jgi:2-C-methyl-D-erythritol 4-phosphate cytidylyltransferase/2-C-methyl-D-erythritol 2,4-cyclodiphosphate synthase
MIPDIRTGFGFDVHKLIPGEGVWLGGVLIPCPYALLGHSDADALLHALCDAIFGTINEGDIGQHFPPTDPQWAGCPSSQFVAYAMEKLHQAGGRLINVDTLIISETPKINPHRKTLQTSIAQMVGLDPSRVNIKATTTETLGFTGRKEGLAAQAQVSVYRGEM